MFYICEEEKGDYDSLRGGFVLGLTHTKRLEPSTAQFQPQSSTNQYHLYHIPSFSPNSRWKPNFAFFQNSKSLILNTKEANLKKLSTFAPFVTHWLHGLFLECHLYQTLKNPKNALLEPIRPVPSSALQVIDYKAKKHPINKMIPSNKISKIFEKTHFWTFSKRHFFAPLQLQPAATYTPWPAATAGNLSTYD